MCSSWESPLSAMLPFLRGPSKPISQHPNPLLDSRGWAHQHNPTLYHATFQTHLTDHISNTQCPLVATTPIDSNHLTRVFFLVVVGGGGGYLFPMHRDQNISWRLPNGCRRISAACCYRGPRVWYVPNLEWQNLVQRKFGASFSNRIKFFGTKYPTHMDDDKWLLFPMDLSLVAISWRLLGCFLLLQTYGIR